MTCPLRCWGSLRLILCAKRLDVGDELPDLITRQAWLPGRHAVSSSFGDRAEKLRVAVSVDPVHVAQAWPHASAGASAVTTRTIEPYEQLASFAHRCSIVGVGILCRWTVRWWSGNGSHGSGGRHDRCRRSSSGR